MSEQQYVYTTHEISNPGNRMKDLESILNEYAREGWRFSGTVDQQGTTTGLLFERAVRE
jgi:hypothetical protein